MDSSFFQFNDLKARKIFSFFLPCLSDPIVRRLKQLTRERRREEIFLSESLEIIRWSFHRDILRTDSRLQDWFNFQSGNWTERVCLSVRLFINRRVQIFSVFSCVHFISTALTISASVRLSVYHYLCPSLSRQFTVYCLYSTTKFSPLT
jgi:hypothetical protein